MKINEKLVITGNRILLVPYERKHVLKYHEWMKSKELQMLTASEPLTLEQEYEMQQSWRNDENKCTFIILMREMYLDSKERELDSMVGDVNLFFNHDEDLTTAEIEIMIAEPFARGMGMGKEALCSMIRYGFEELNLAKVSAKIGYTNYPSISMFQKIGFIEVSRSDVFEEVTFELKLTDEIRSNIKEQTASYGINIYL